MKAKYHFIVLYLEWILSSDIHKAAGSMYNEKIDNIHIMSSTCESDGLRGRNVPIKNTRLWSASKSKRKGVKLYIHGDFHTL